MEPFWAVATFVAGAVVTLIVGEVRAVRDDARKVAAETREADARSQSAQRDRIRDERLDRLRQTREWVELACDMRMLPRSSPKISELAAHQSQLVKNDLSLLGTDALRTYITLMKSQHQEVPTHASQIAVSAARAPLRVALNNQEERILRDEPAIVVDPSVGPELADLADALATSPQS